MRYSTELTDKIVVSCRGCKNKCRIAKYNLTVPEEQYCYRCKRKLIKNFVNNKNQNTGKTNTPNRK